MVTWQLQCFLEWHGRKHCIGEEPLMALACAQAGGKGKSSSDKDPPWSWTAVGEPVS